MVKLVVWLLGRHMLRTAQSKEEGSIVSELMLSESEHELWKSGSLGAELSRMA